jgi:outer membrane protein OmpA-like peptidoglycan-associated protein
MGRLGAILALAVLLAAGCAKKAGPKPEVGVSPAPTPTLAPQPVPFTDRELAHALRQQGGSAAATGRKEYLPEVTETPRGVVVTLPHTYFAFDSFDLDARARRIVERIAYVLNHPRAADRTVALEGHADAIGTEAYNLTLSRRRAETVARELVGQGVRRERVTVEAYGESRPLAPNRNRDGTDNPTGRARNRRVEAIIRK